jgi:hypothetical protein
MAGKLKNRSPITSTLAKKLKLDLDNLHDITRIPKTRLLDEAVMDLLKKYEHVIQNHKPNE